MSGRARSTSTFTRFAIRFCPPITSTRNTSSTRVGMRRNSISPTTTATTMTTGRAAELRDRAQHRSREIGRVIAAPMSRDRGRGARVRRCDGPSRTECRLQKVADEDERDSQREQKPGCDRRVDARAREIARAAVRLQLVTDDRGRRTRRRRVERRNAPNRQRRERATRQCNDDQGEQHHDHHVCPRLNR